MMKTFLSLQETVSKYKVKIKDGDKEVDEEIDVDTEKQTETIQARRVGGFEGFERTP